VRPAAPAGPDDDADATALVAALRRRALSCRELMSHTLQRIERLNPGFNAVVALQPQHGLLAQADAADAALARGERVGALHGLPWAVKDLNDTAGIVTTYGSPLFAQHVPAHDALMVRRLRSAGAIVAGKTPTPEWGLGSHTYSAVHGVTRNAWNPALSAGGSSGGAAVALALRLLPLADGSDMMGSLRNPAGWAGVFGLRPSQGRVPDDVTGDAYLAQLGTCGPMARSVRDLALLLSVQAGEDPRAPLSLPGDGREFAAAPASWRPDDARGLRIGWLGDLGGHLAVEPGVLAVCEIALRRFEALGAAVEPAALGFAPPRVWDTWLAWRRCLVAGRLAAHWADPAQRAQLKPEAQWECAQGEAMSAAQLHAASVERSAFARHMASLFARFDLLALPSAQVWPFPAGWTWPREVAGRAMDTYHRWLEVSIYATLAGLPAASVPAGFDDDAGIGRAHPAGVPMGLQLVGPPRGELVLLRAAAAYETAVADLLARRPPALRAGSGAA
jgi:amidase